MPSWTLTTAPKWAKNAIATDRGWVDPKNGDVLVSCTRLVNAVSYADAIGKGVTTKPAAIEKSGGFLRGGRKTDKERVVAAKQKLIDGVNITAGEAGALKKVGVDVDPSKVDAPVKRKRKPRKPRKKITAVIKQAITKTPKEETEGE